MDTRMYIIRRVAKTQPGKAWEVAGYLTKITQAYEEAGRNKAQVYVGGLGAPGTSNVWLRRRSWRPGGSAKDP